MFGFKTIVVGNLPNTKLAAAITAAAEYDGTKIDHTEIIRVYEWAWLGDWIETVVAYAKVLSKYPFPSGDALEALEKEIQAFTAKYPSVARDDRASYLAPIINGSEQQGVFDLECGAAIFGDSEGEITRESCAFFACQSLVSNQIDTCELVYGVIMTESTWAKQNSHIMLKALHERQANEVIHFSIRVFVVKTDDSVAMHEL